MDVQVIFTTQLKALLGRGSQTVRVSPAATLRQAIDRAAAEHSQEFSQLVFDGQGRLLPSILLCVNDQQVGEDHVLVDGDTITLLSAISGG